MTTLLSDETRESLELIIFDCDGVLIDSEALSAKVLTDVLLQEGVRTDFDFIRENFLGRSFQSVIAGIFRTYGVTLSEGFEARYILRLLADFEQALEATQGVFDIVNSVSIPICIATSSSPQRVARSLEIVGLAAYFEGSVFTASEVENGKPAPDLFLHAAAKMGVAPARCLVIEDSVPGVEAALSAGMDVVRYIGGTHFAGAAPAEIENVVAFDNWSKLVDLRPTLFEGRPR